ncbi:hypothetical protein J6590_041392 [Homalodisca vitripennis]|nr:hypothetical protein J6590_041392 [Homalodisca vitripennis]
MRNEDYDFSKCCLNTWCAMVSSQTAGFLDLPLVLLEGPTLNFNLWNKMTFGPAEVIMGQVACPHLPRLEVDDLKRCRYFGVDSSPSKRLPNRRSTAWNAHCTFSLIKDVQIKEVNIRLGAQSALVAWLRSAGIIRSNPISAPGAPRAPASQHRFSVLPAEPTALCSTGLAASLRAAAGAPLMSLSPPIPQSERVSCVQSADPMCSDHHSRTCRNTAASQFPHPGCPRPARALTLHRSPSSPPPPGNADRPTDIRKPLQKIYSTIVVCISYT